MARLAVVFCGQRNHERDSCGARQVATSAIRVLQQTLTVTTRRHGSRCPLGRRTAGAAAESLDLLRRG